VANVSYYRPATSRENLRRRGSRRSNELHRGPRRGRIVAGVIVLIVLAGAGVAAFVLTSAKASLTNDTSALAKIGMPLGGGKIESVLAFGLPDNRPVPVVVRGDQIWPQHQIRAGKRITIQVVVKRPGWISWLAGKTQRLTLTVVTPTANLTSHYLTIKPGSPLQLHFAAPVTTISYGPNGDVHRHVLPSPESVVTIPHAASAGTLAVAATIRTWEKSSTSLISWFPAGSATAATASPAPGTKILPSTPIYLTFSKPLSQALGSGRPPVNPTTAGTWHTVNAHTIVFRPTGYGYGLGANVTVGLPSGVHLIGGRPTWTVPPGSTVRLQQMLSLLGYLPVQFNYAGSGVPLTPQAQEQAAVNPPKGKFSMRYPNTPSALQSMWSPGSSGVMTQGAIMAFENDNDMTADGVAGAAVWKALLNAVISGKKSSFGYTFVQVSEGSPEGETTWHNGKTVVSGAVNTGIPATPTAQGVFPVFEHALSVTMEGTNADGSHYDDPGVPYVSYFNAGDALHGFIRASYGFPQSDGCVEMPYSEASSVYPYTPIGTLVDVS
jgi:peptidoglycan hydrolase-like protein with peptidoglycan-binding domain